MSIQSLPVLLAAALLSPAVAAVGDTELADLQPGRNFPLVIEAFGASRSENIDAGDVDNDGDPDVVVANGGDFGPEANRIYVNGGGVQGSVQGSFSDGTAVRFAGVPDDTSRDIELVDLDGDFDLDVHVANRGSNINGGEVSRTYLNQGGAQFGLAGFFAEATDGFWGQLVSVPAADQVFGGDVGPFRSFSCDCEFGDLDNDGDLDLFHSSYGPNINATRDSRVFLNDGGGRFDELWPWADAAADTKVHTIDLDLADLDGDYDLDVFMSSRDSQARVFRNDLQADGSWPADAFVDVTRSALIDTGATLIGTDNYECEFGDLDGDGDFDIWAVNYQNFSESVLTNEGGLTFIKRADAIDNDHNSDDNEADFLDFDGDGDLDVLLANWSGTNHLYVNSLAQGLAGGELFERAGANGEYPHAETPAAGNGGTSLDGECVDLDGDGDTDILLANDGNQNNRYWPNLLGLPDTHAPTLQQLTQQGDKADGSDTPVIAQLRDNAAYYVIATYTVDLLYRVDDGLEHRVRMTSQGGQQFRGVIPGGIDGQIAYRVAGADDAGNSFSSATVSYEQSASGVVPNQSVGVGTVGSLGRPWLALGGDFAPASVVSANLIDVLHDAPALLFASLASTPTLFKGGLLHTVPVALEVALTTGVSSQVYFEASWPAGIPSGTELWFQYGVGDPAGVGGAALSNAVRVMTP